LQSAISTVINNLNNEKFNSIPLCGVPNTSWTFSLSSHLYASNSLALILGLQLSIMFAQNHCIACLPTTYTRS